MFIKSKPVKYGIKVWVAANAKNFYTYNMQAYTGKTDGPREKKKGLRVVKGMVCHTYGSGPACEGMHLYEINKVLVFETIPQLD